MLIRRVPQPACGCTKLCHALVGVVLVVIHALPGEYEWCSATLPRQRAYTATGGCADGTLAVRTCRALRVRDSAIWCM
jgi:hypothetical protein